jgi:hypothetical protein
MEQNILISNFFTSIREQILKSVKKILRAEDYQSRNDLISGNDPINEISSPNSKLIIKGMKYVKNL